MCLIPILLGFIIPILFIIGNVVYEFDRIDFEKVLDLTSNTFIVSLIASSIIIFIAVYFQFLKRIIKNKTLTVFNEAISLTYALPGAVIGLSLNNYVYFFPLKVRIFDRIICSFNLCICNALYGCGNFSA